MIEINVKNNKGEIVLTTTDYEAALIHDRILDLAEQLMPVMTSLGAEGLSEKSLENLCINMVKNSEEVLKILSQPLARKRTKKSSSTSGGDDTGENNITGLPSTGESDGLTS